MGEWIRSGAWIPFLSAIGVIVSVVLTAFAWGLRDAQERALKTWKELAEARDETIKELKAEQEEMQNEIHLLRTELKLHQETTKQAIDELIAGFARAKEI